MKNEFIKITNSSEYIDSCPAEYDKYFQLHILSYSQIISTYYLKSSFDFETIKNNVHNLLKTIQKRSNLCDNVSLFENEGIFLISESEKLFNNTELFEFDLKQGCYEYIDGNMNPFDFIGDIPSDVFIKKALTTVGAKSLYSIVEPLVQDLLKEQVRMSKRFLNPCGFDFSPSGNRRVGVFTAITHFKPIQKNVYKTYQRRTKVVFES
jgi:hypothetical protein